MKKMLTLLLALAMVLSLAACGGDKSGQNAGDSTPAAGDSQNSGTETPDTGTDAPAFTTVEEGKLHMSTNAAFPPYEMTTDDGGFEGIDVEVAQAIAGKLGLELVVDDMGFDAALLAAQNGQSDMVMAGVTVNEERLAVMDFSDSYATGVQVVIVKEGSPIATVDDLANAQMIGCQKATTGYIYCSDDPENGGYGEDHVTAYETGALAVQALVNGQVDAVVIDNEPAKSFVAANEGLKILDTEFAVEDYAIGFAKGNSALLDAVNAAMADLKADGTFQGIVDKYITAE
ncbi:MAG: amino acid ABC transporter substrate-binding protein [Oscillibacter sp.]|nr:amino acid ABC transporter substrate-binding protein [Oscillibacter sp.]